MLFNPILVENSAYFDALSHFNTFRFCANNPVSILSSYLYNLCLCQKNNFSDSLREALADPLLLRCCQFKNGVQNICEGNNVNRFLVFIHYVHSVNFLLRNTRDHFSEFGRLQAGLRYAGAGRL